MVYLITYELNSSGQNYTDLYNSLKSFSSCWHNGLDSTWLIESNLPANEIYDILSPSLDSNDFILVIKVANQYYGWLPKDAWEWLQSKNF